MPPLKFEIATRDKTHAANIISPTVSVPRLERREIVTHIHGTGLHVPSSYASRAESDLVGGMRAQAGIRIISECQTWRSIRSCARVKPSAGRITDNLKRRVRNRTAVIHADAVISNHQIKRASWGNVISLKCKPVQSHDVIRGIAGDLALTTESRAEIFRRETGTIRTVSASRHREGVHIPSGRRINIERRGRHEPLGGRLFVPDLDAICSATASIRHRHRASEDRRSGRENTAVRVGNATHVRSSGRIRKNPSRCRDRSDEN